MWFIGLILGAALGAAITPSAMFAGGVIGTLIGLYLGQTTKETKVAAHGTAGDEERLQTLEAQVAWLHRETQRLRGEIAGLKGETASAPAPEPAMPQAAMGAAPEESGYAVPSGVFVDPTPTQPGDVQPLADAPEPAAEVLNQAPGRTGGLAESCATGGHRADLVAASHLRQPAGQDRRRPPLFRDRFGPASGRRLRFSCRCSCVCSWGAVGGLAMVAFGWTRCRPAEEGAQPAHWAFGIAPPGGRVRHPLPASFISCWPAMPWSGRRRPSSVSSSSVSPASCWPPPRMAWSSPSSAWPAPSPRRFLASTGSGDPVPLFAYFTLLNLFIVGVSWFKAWRVLNVTGFFFTIGVGMAWAVEHYQAQYFGVTQGFLLFFWALYSATPVLMALFRAPGLGRLERWHPGLRHAPSSASPSSPSWPVTATSWPGPPWRRPSGTAPCGACCSAAGSRPAWSWERCQLGPGHRLRYPRRAPGLRRPR